MNKIELSIVELAKSANLKIEWDNQYAVLMGDYGMHHRVNRDGEIESFGGFYFKEIPQELRLMEVEHEN